MNKIIAIPSKGNEFEEHFGHCEEFTIFETDDNSIISYNTIHSPEHRPGAYPRFLKDQGVNVVIAGRMGQRARQMYTSNNIDVIIGVQRDSLRNLVDKFLNNLLQSEILECDNHDLHRHCHH